MSVSRRFRMKVHVVDPSPDRGEVYSVIRCVTGVSWKTARDLVDAEAPLPLLPGVSPHGVHRILTRMGARVTLRSSGTP